MTRKGEQPIFFVCAAISNSGELITELIQAISQQEAASLFLEKNLVNAKNILGPFRKKRAQVIENTRSLKFTEQRKNAIYSDWEVNAWILKEPENHAFLIFMKKVDGKKASPPKGTIIVPISELRFI